MRRGVKINDVVIVDKAFEAEIQDIFHIVKDTPFETCLIHPLNNEKFPPVYSANNELVDIATSVSIENITIHRGTAVTSNTFPAPIELYEKVKMREPQCIDMETSALYQAAWLLNIKILAVRGISNVLSDDGTDENIHQSDLKGSAHNAASVVFKMLDTLSMKYRHRAEENPIIEVDRLMKQYKLEPHPEGGYFSSFFKSQHQVVPDANRYLGESRSAGTSIYYLLNKTEFSAWHCLKSDEIWHYYHGSPVRIYVIDKSGNLITHLLGDPLELQDASFQVLISADNWFAAENVDINSYSFVGCTVSPGFEYRDFTLAVKTQLLDEFPQHRSIIERLTQKHLRE